MARGILTNFFKFQYLAVPEKRPSLQSLPPRAGPFNRMGNKF